MKDHRNQIHYLSLEEMAIFEAYCIRNGHHEFTKFTFNSEQFAYFISKSSNTLECVDLKREYLIVSERHSMYTDDPERKIEDPIEEIFSVFDFALFRTASGVLWCYHARSRKWGRSDGEKMFRCGIVRFSISLELCAF